MEAQVDRAQARIARRWGAATDEIGFVPSVADGVAMVAESMAFQPGDNVVVDALEYPSVVAPFALQRAPAVEIRVARGTNPDRVAALVNARTRVIGASCVSYMTGERFDLSALRAAADRVGAMLVVDFTQAAGWMPIDASVTDFAFSACYKWLLGTTGTAIAFWNRSRQPDWAPSTAGWNSIAAFGRPDWLGPIGVKPGAARFTRGNPAHGPVYVLNAALDHLDRHDPDLLRQHVGALTAALIDRLTRAGIPLTTPAEPVRHGANVCMDSNAAQAMCNELHTRQIYGWNGHGRLRFSFHGYNAMDDVDRIAVALPSIWRP
jgi:selenocysteine lyase/cysteine desulfurase